MTNSRSAGSKKPLLGSTEPRLWTPPLRELTEDTSLGFEAIEFSEGVLGRPLHPWQKWFLIHSLELAPGSFTYDPAPVLRFKTVLLLVARQNGKSYIMSTRLLWRMIMWESQTPEPPLILGTAHKLSAAEEILDLSYKAMTRSDELREWIKRKSNVNGDKHVELINGSRYKCEAASDDGGRGLSVTDLGFDELRQQKDWSPWTAMTNTTNAIPGSQIIGVSNAGEAKSVVLASLRSKALADIAEYQAHLDGGGDPTGWGGGSDSTRGLFEYSAPDDCDIWDREGWAMANPSLGYPGGPTEATIASMASMVGKPGEGMPEHKFRTENLCQWVTVAAEGPFPSEALEACLDPVSEIAPDSPIYLAVDTSKDRDMTYLAVAGWRDDGLPHVEVISQRAYTEWVPDFLAGGLAFKPDAVIVQGRGAPASTIIDFIEKTGTQVTRCEGGDLTAACGQFFDRVIQGTIRWGEQPVLQAALAEAVKKTFGDSWAWNRDKSPVDIAPLCAVTFALWGLVNSKKEEQKTSAYDEEYERWW